MEDALLGAMTGPEDELGAELFGPERGFTDGLALSPATAAAERDELPVLADAYLGATEPGEQLLRALSPSPGAEVPAALLGDFPGLPELRTPDDAAPPPAYSVHVLSSLLPGARGPALLPLSAGVRVIPVSASRGRRRTVSPRAFPPPPPHPGVLSQTASSQSPRVPGDTGTARGPLELSSVSLPSLFPFGNTHLLSIT